MTVHNSWIPGILLTLGAIASAGAGAQRSMPLDRPLAEVIPAQIDGQKGTDQTISDNEQRVAGMDSYVLRNFSASTAADALIGFSVYVGYYERQTRGHTIHSPKNCLPGAGWEALTASTTAVPTAQGNVTVTKYLLQREEERAVVLYWYQGRGRVEANEYKVKWNLLRDAAMRRRSDEALVRVVVPFSDSEEKALATATSVATTIMPALSKALPE
jgi:EpsI family protein